DGITWDTDYVMNFSEMKMSVRLDRSYSPDAVTEETRFSTPHFITLLWEGKYLKDDGNLPVSRLPYVIDENNVDLLGDIIAERVRYRLPVVYVSKSYYDEDPVDVNLMAGRLKGVAHVLVQECIGTNDMIRNTCDSRNEYYGAIGIYYPNPSVKHRKYLYRKETEYDEALMEKVIHAVIKYTSSHLTDPLYTWQGVNNALLREHLDKQMKEREKAEIARKEAEKREEDLLVSLDEEEKRIRRKAFEDARHESDAILESYDQDFQRLRKEVEELTKQIEALQYENEGLHSKLSSSDAVPLLYMGEEKDFYQGEIRDLILSVLSDSIHQLQDKSRRQDVVKDIVENNEYQKLSEQREELVKKLLKDYTGMTPKLRQAFEDLGFVITEEGKHLKLTYYGDGRYYTIFAKTPSDHRSGKNNASKLSRTVF
ncbi:MAG: hypothetical protein K6A40_01710, partial [Solobacterium sp.]|nr:hypothetical protein [Solobacterium sp.]